MTLIQAKRPAATSKGPAPVRRPAGMQAIDLTLYLQIRQAVQELSQPRPPVAAA